ncbi:putative dual specificity tyrosine-phosphorylation-regulated kinase 4-like, partial [Apostichopus japonicus]
SRGHPRCTTNSKGKKRKPNSKDLRYAIKTTDSLFLDFISRCLEWDPLERMTPDQALQHDWIQDAKLYYQNKSKDSQHHRQSNSNHQRRGGGGKEKRCENASSKKLKERRPSPDNKTHNSSTTAEANKTQRHSAKTKAGEVKGETNANLADVREEDERKTESTEKPINKVKPLSIDEGESETNEDQSNENSKDAKDVKGSNDPKCDSKMEGGQFLPPIVS